MKIAIDKHDQRMAKVILEKLYSSLRKEEVDKYYASLLNRIINAKDDDEKAKRYVEMD